MFISVALFIPGFIEDHSTLRISSSIQESDTIQKKQDLYNGIKWTNRYRKFDVSQFLFSDLFLQGAVSMNSKTFNNVRLKYDIVNDEIITPVNFEDIIQLNMEMVDSFSLQYEGKKYIFFNLKNDTLNNLSGYFQLLYRGNSSLFVKHKKLFATSADMNSDGTFNEVHTIYLSTNGFLHPLFGRRTLYKVLMEDLKDEVKSYVRENRLKVSKKTPASFIEVIRYYDSISYNKRGQK